MKVFLCLCLQMSPALNLFVADVIQSEFAAHCSAAHVLAHTHSLLLWVQCREAGSCPEVEEKSGYGPLCWQHLPYM